MHRVEPTKLQYLALQFAEKAAIFVENNERLLESRTGGGEGGYRGYNKNESGGKQPTKERGQWQDTGYTRQPYQQYNKPRQNYGSQQRYQDGHNRYNAGQSGQRRYDDRDRDREHYNRNSNRGKSY